MPAANYPCLTIPMGYKTTENHGTYLIARPIKKMPFKMDLPSKKQQTLENTSRLQLTK
jgi:hypothetical protein